jgi:hypothetical protein
MNKEIKETWAKLSSLMVINVYECHGDKCRERLCASCNEPSEAQAAAKEAAALFIKMNNAMKESVILSQSAFDSLVEDSCQLNALHAAGVDNWEGYGTAMEEDEEEDEEDEDSSDK